MWGFGGKHYWERKEEGKLGGIVVVFAWMSSQEKHLKNYTDLYASLGWNSLILHSHFLNLFFPDKAESLAVEIMNELVQELKLRPCPIVFASFSGGPKACMYKVLQILEGKCEDKFSLDEYCLVRECVSGHIFDSTPVDFVRDIGTRFVLHPTVLGMSPPPFASFVLNGIFSGLDTLFHDQVEAQRAEYWQTLYNTVSMGAPYLILCSEDDDLAPFQVINNFATRLKDLGADVNLVKWSTSSHVGHLRHYAEGYTAAVSELLRKASVIYSHRRLQLEGENICIENSHNGEVSDPHFNQRNAAEKSRRSFHQVALDLNDHFLVPSSMEYLEGRDASPIQAKQNEHHYSPVFTPPRINPHGVLGQLLFDVCVPKIVEDWDLKSSSASTRATFASARRHSPLNPIKCIRRSRL